MSIYVDLVAEEANLYISLDDALLDYPEEIAENVIDKRLLEYIYSTYDHLCGIKKGDEDLIIDMVFFIGIEKNSNIVKKVCDALSLFVFDTDFTRMSGYQ